MDSHFTQAMKGFSFCIFFFAILLAGCETPAWQNFNFEKAEKLVNENGLGDSLAYASLGEIHYKNMIPGNPWPEIKFQLNTDQNQSQDPVYAGECKRVNTKLQPLINFLLEAKVSDYYLSRDGSFIQFYNHFNEDTWAYEGFIYQLKPDAPQDSMLFRPIFNESYFPAGQVEKVNERWYKFANFYGRNEVSSF